MDCHQAKILAIGDLHIRLSNMTSMEIILRYLIELVNAQNPDLVVLLGDTLHTHGKINMLEHNFAVEWISELSEHCRRCLLLIGNHDRPNNRDYMGKNHPFVGVKIPNLEIVASPWHREINGIGVVAIPYVPPGKFPQAISDSQVKNPDLILCHQEFKGADMEGYRSTNGDGEPQHECLVISGHIHKYQRLNQKIVYVGTPMQQSFGEDANKGVSLFTVTKRSGNFSWSELRFPSPIKPRQTLEISHEKIDEIKIDPEIPTRVIIHGPSASLKALRHPIMEMPNVKIILLPEIPAGDEAIAYGFRREKLISHSFTDLITEALSGQPEMLELWKSVTTELIRNEAKRR